MDGKLELILQKLEDGNDLSEREVRTAFQEVIRMGATVNRLTKNNIMVRLGKQSSKSLIVGAFVFIFLSQLVADIIIQIIPLDTLILQALGL